MRRSSQGSITNIELEGSRLSYTNNIEYLKITEDSIIVITRIPNNEIRGSKRAPDKVIRQVYSVVEGRISLTYRDEAEYIPPKEGLYRFKPLIKENEDNNSRD